MHLAALVAVCAFVVPRQMPMPPASFAVVMATPPEPAAAAEAGLQPARLNAGMQTVVSALATPMRLSLAPMTDREVRFARTPRREVAAPLKSMAGPGVEPGASLGRAPAVAKASATSVSARVPGDELAGLEARIRQAVQDAATYPASARMMRLEGRTQVRFDYTDGAVGAANVATSSRFAMLDRAALAAVRRAALPHAPAGIGARTLPLLVWVDFRLIRED